MPLPGKYSPIDIKPLTGFLDVRSSADSVPPGAWRWRQNVSVSEKGNLCRRPQWKKLFDKETYNNEDLHDQLLTLQEYYEDRAIPHTPQTDIITYPPGETANARPMCNVNKLVRGTGRQPLTFLYAAVATSGERKLLAGTQNRIYALNEPKGNWKIIADAYGGDPVTTGISERRWSAAQVEDTVVFVNGFDAPVAWVFDQPTFGCAMQAVSEIESLAGIGLTKAAVVGAWQGIIMLGDVEVDGERQENGLQWSQAFDPLNFTPVSGDTNSAGFQRLGAGERIMAMKPLGDVLLIYTSKSIWECRWVGAPKAFEFRSLYSEPENGTGCLAYPFTLVSTGDEHLYLGRDGVYVFNLFLPRPERAEWMHAASGEIFKSIDSNRCDSHTGWFDPNEKEYWVSWMEEGYSFPRRSLVFNTRYHTTDVVDHGFTAFCTYQPDTRPTLLQWLKDNLICVQSEIAANADLITPEVKEGGYCLAQTAYDCGSTHTELLTAAGTGGSAEDVECGIPGSSEDLLTDPINQALTTEVANSTLAICQNRNLPIWTNTAKDIDGRMVEDTDAAGDADSLCTALGDMDLDEICHECESAGILIAASAVDWCLKEMGGDVFYRERCVSCAPCGVYVRDPFDSILRTGAMDFGWSREDKQARSLEVEFQAAEQAVPSALQMRFGHSTQAINPNEEHCALLWRPLQPKNLECQSKLMGAQHIANGTRPNKPLAWHFLFRARYFYVEMKISGINGSTCFSRLSLEVRQAPRSITMG